MKYSNKNIGANILRSILISIIFFFTFGNLFAQPEIPKLKTYATDLTGTLSNLELNKLNMELRKFDNITSNQIVFLMISSLNGYPIEMFANEVAEKNKIGTKENDNGILFIVAKKDRKMRIEVGYGLEGALPDALASSIIRNDVAPYFKKNKYYSGVVSGLSSIIAATKGEYVNNRKRREDEEFGFPWGMIVFIIIFLVFGRNRGGLGTLLLLNALGGSGRSSGGFGGGGFGGGFSGGGGGFGGGGASGGW